MFCDGRGDKTAGDEELKSYRGKSSGAGGGKAAFPSASYPTEERERRTESQT